RAGPAPARRAPGRSHPPVPGPRRCRRGSASCRALADSARAVLDLALRRLIASKQKSAMVDGNLIAGYALGNDATVLATDHDFAHIAAVTALQHEYVQPSLDSGCGLMPEPRRLVRPPPPVRCLPALPPPVTSHVPPAEPSATFPW